MDAEKSMGSRAETSMPRVRPIRRAPSPVLFRSKGYMINLHPEQKMKRSGILMPLFSPAPARLAPEGGTREKARLYERPDTV